jgi:hypothetical protein
MSKKIILTFVTRGVFSCSLKNLNMSEVANEEI